MRGISSVRKAALTGVAAVCFVLGLATVWTPIPTGVPLLAISLLIMIGISPTARRLMRAARLRYDRLDRAVAWVEDRAHRRMATPLRRTRPLSRKRRLRIEGP